MLVSEKDLVKILSQPGYSADGPLAAPSTQAGPGKAHQDIRSSDSLMGAESHTGRPGRSGSLWRNEREFMAAVFEHAAHLATVYPEIGLLYHIPNENAHRQPGVRAGYPDCHLPCARGGFHGLWIELKLATGRLSAEQVIMCRRLEMEGHRVEVVYESLDRVIEILEEYVRG